MLGNKSRLAPFYVGKEGRVKMHFYTFCKNLGNKEKLGNNHI